MTLRPILDTRLRGGDDPVAPLKEIRQKVTIDLVLPYLLDDGHELSVSGTGATYRAAKQNLDHELSVWREAFAIELEVRDE